MPLNRNTISIPIDQDLVARAQQTLTDLGLDPSDFLEKAIEDFLGQDDSTIASKVITYQMHNLIEDNFTEEIATEFIALVNLATQFSAEAFRNSYDELAEIIKERRN